ncbi:hypothetical protein RFI_37237, partial [Reticulomyxa filosa]
KIIEKKKQVKVNQQHPAEKSNIQKYKNVLSKNKQSIGPAKKNENGYSYTQNKNKMNDQMDEIKQLKDQMLHYKQPCNNCRRLFKLCHLHY